MRLDVPATSSTTTTTTNSGSFLPPQQEWDSRSRSRTEPVIIRQDASLHKSRSSVDESPRRTRRTSPDRAPPSVTHVGEHSEAAGQHSPTRKPTPRRLSVGPLSPPISLPAEVREVISNPPAPNTPNGSIIPSSTSYFKPPNNLSNLVQRSPPQKRPPASRSSHGVETSTGPPPAISTQRTYSQDKIWQPILPVEPPAPPSPLSRLGPEIQLNDSPTSSNDSSVKNTANTSPAESHNSSAVPSRNNSIKDEGKKMTMTTRYTDDIASGDPDRTIRGPDAMMADHDSVATGSDKSQPRNEDIFLNIARANSRRDAAAERAERRRSRIHGADRVTRDYSTNSPQIQLAASEMGDEIPTRQEPILSSDRPAMSLLHDNFNRRSSLQPRSSAASAHPLDDAGRMRYFDHGSRSSFGYSRSRLGRDGSPDSAPKIYDRRVSAQDPTRAYRQSNLSATRNNRMVSGQDFMEEPSPPEELRRLDDTESTISNTATSTVWDELDDLKSRIRKLELTGKLPSSSAAAMSNMNDRPRTATTTITTMSSSPKQGRKPSSSPAESTIAGLNSSVQPLLTSALGKAKSVLNKEVFRALEATVADAVSLSSVLGNDTPQSSIASTIGGNVPFERQIRRKADSMCRSLTELCLALSENDQTITIPKQRPVSRDTNMSHLGGTSSGNSTWGMDGASRYQRGTSLEPEERPRTSSRVPSRLEARRTSMLLGSQPQHTQSSPITASDRFDTRSQIQTTPPSPRPATNRSSTVLLRSRRAPESVVGTPDDNTEYIRPVSRAMTEINPTARTPPHQSSRISINAQRALREYTSQHPLPANTSSQRSPSLASPSSIPPRRNYLSAIPNPNPAASTSNIQPGNRRYASRYVSGSVVGSGASEVGKPSSSGSRLTVTATGAASQTSVNGNSNRHVNRRSLGYGNGNGVGTGKTMGKRELDGAADMDTNMGDTETTRKRGISTSSVRSRKGTGKTLSREEVRQLPVLNAQMARDGEI